MKRYSLIGAGLFIFLSGIGQNDLTLNYRAYLVRQDNNTVVFNMQALKEKGETVLYILNADERIRISQSQMIQ
jgi:hypothetical protein